MKWGCMCGSRPSMTSILLRRGRHQGGTRRGKTTRGHGAGGPRGPRREAAGETGPADSRACRAGRRWVPVAQAPQGVAFCPGSPSGRCAPSSWHGLFPHGDAVSPFGIDLQLPGACYIQLSKHSILAAFCADRDIENGFCSI